MTIDVTVDDGKYRVIQRENYRLEILRYDEPWLGETESIKGSKCIIAMACELEELRQRVAYQSRVADWMMQCFGADITNSRMERCYRFSEEAGELVQSLGMTEQQWHDIGAYVWGRPVGETHQEIGGVMVTLAALCHAAGHDMDGAGEAELSRVGTPEMIDKIRRKHNDKKLRIPTSALPGGAE